MLKCVYCTLLVLLIDYFEKVKCRRKHLQMWNVAFNALGRRKRRHVRTFLSEYSYNNTKGINYRSAYAMADPYPSFETPGLAAWWIKRLCSLSREGTNELGLLTDGYIEAMEVLPEPCGWLRCCLAISASFFSYLSATHSAAATTLVHMNKRLNSGTSSSATATTPKLQ